ncbi:MAG: hypothetical protein KAY65_05035, partial [Planctomycetes bacterium]|nr:hypothetical protein [Planctomycetota bacterium]
RFGSAGGLSQPSRDTVDPTESVKRKAQNAKLPRRRRVQQFLALSFKFSASFPTPCDRAITIAVHYTIATK